MGGVPVYVHVRLVASVLGGAAVHYGPLGQETGYLSGVVCQEYGRLGQGSVLCSRRWEIDSWSLVRQPPSRIDCCSSEVGGGRRTTSQVRL